MEKKKQRLPWQELCLSPLADLENIVIVTGHYGTGKTNLAVNLAVDFASKGEDVVLVDMDTVNPYFRSADFKALAEKKDFSLISPPYAGSSLDLPVLTAAIDAQISGEKRLILDVGGDDAGARALGRYAAKLLKKPYSMLYVINYYRFLTQTPAAATSYADEIMQASRLSLTHIVNNSNLSQETTTEHVLDSLPFAQEVAKQLGLPLLMTSFDEKLVIDCEFSAYPLTVYVKAPWQTLESEGGA